MKSFRSLLMQYAKWDQHIKLVYRPLDAAWNKGCFYGDDKYDEFTPYNHRSILCNEVVFEWDTEDKEQNKKYADRMASKLRMYGLPYAKWDTSNKSTHLHTLVNTTGVTNLTLFKKTFIRVLCNDLPLPDMQLAGPHLIRAEYGLHEKTGGYKTLISASGGYPKVGRAPPEVWEAYAKASVDASEKRLKGRLHNLVDSPSIKYLLDTKNLKEVGDGRRKGLFILINVLKPSYEGKLDELSQLMKSWYKYTGGQKLSEKDIEAMVYYPVEYRVSERYITEYLEELGVKLNKAL